MKKLDSYKFYIGFALLVGMMLSFALAGSFAVALLCYFAIAMLRSVKSPLSAAWLNQNLESSTRATVFSMQAQADALVKFGRANCWCHSKGHIYQSCSVGFDCSSDSCHRFV